MRWTTVAREPSARKPAASCISQPPQGRADRGTGAGAAAAPVRFRQLDEGDPEDRPRDAAQAVLLEIQRLDAVRRARHLRLLFLESYPESPPRVLERAGAALRGE